jgi:hypothetical protein
VGGKLLEQRIFIETDENCHRHLQNVTVSLWRGSNEKITGVCVHFVISRWKGSC